MSQPARCAILFFSSNHAIWAARLLKASGLAARLIPTPKHLSSECGHAVDLAASDAPRAAEALAGRGVPFDRIVEL